MLVVTSSLHLPAFSCAIGSMNLFWLWPQFHRNRAHRHANERDEGGPAPDVLRCSTNSSVLIVLWCRSIWYSGWPVSLLKVIAVNVVFNGFWPAINYSLFSCCVCRPTSNLYTRFEWTFAISLFNLCTNTDPGHVIQLRCALDKLPGTIWVREKEQRVEIFCFVCIGRNWRR